MRAIKLQRESTGFESSYGGDMIQPVQTQPAPTSFQPDIQENIKNKKTRRKKIIYGSAIGAGVLGGAGIGLYARGKKVQSGKDTSQVAKTVAPPPPSRANTPITIQDLKPHKPTVTQRIVRAVKNNKTINNIVKSKSSKYRIPGNAPISVESFRGVKIPRLSEIVLSCGEEIILEEKMKKTSKKKGIIWSKESDKRAARGREIGGAIGSVVGTGAGLMTKRFRYLNAIGGGMVGHSAGSAIGHIAGRLSNGGRNKRKKLSEIHDEVMFVGEQILFGEI
jgi:hypothetical protein